MDLSFSFLGLKDDSYRFRSRQGNWVSYRLNIMLGAFLNNQKLYYKHILASLTIL